MKPALLAIALLLTLPVRAADPAAAQITDADSFAEALEACMPSSHAAPHPFMKGFVIQHVIAGEKDDACVYSQTMPGDMRMECRLSEAGRGGLAGEFREQAQGRMSGGTGEQPAWTSECEIVGKDGKRTPMGA